jgi:hypothetical protein
MSGSETTGGRVRRVDGRVYITLGGVEHGMTAAEAMALMRAIGKSIVAAPRLRTALARGDAIVEMRTALVHRNDLYHHGDAVLRWVNEGDLWMLPVLGIPVEDLPYAE